MLALGTGKAPQTALEEARLDDSPAAVAPTSGFTLRTPPTKHRPRQRGLEALPRDPEVVASGHPGMLTILATYPNRRRLLVDDLRLVVQGHGHVAAGAGHALSAGSRSPGVLWWDGGFATAIVMALAGQFL